MRVLDPYMRKTEELLSQGKVKLEKLALAMKSAAPAHSALARRRRLMNVEARYAEVARRFEMLRSAGTEGIADLKVGLEKAWDAFRVEVGWKDPQG